MKNLVRLVVCMSLFAVESFGFDVDLKTLPPGKSFTLQFQVMIDDPLPDTVQELTAQGVVSVTGFADIPTDDPDTPEALDPTLTRVFQPPIAQCRDVTLMANDDLVAIVGLSEVDDGSFDPDGSPVTYVLSPAGPFELGSTNVALWVLDNEGDLTSCNAVITVLDPRTSLFPQDLIDLLDSVFKGDSSTTDLVRRSSFWYSPSKTSGSASSGPSKED